MTPIDAPPLPVLSLPSRGFRPSPRLLFAADTWGPPVAAGLLLAAISSALGVALPWPTVAAVTGLMFACSFGGSLVWVRRPAAHVGVDGLRGSGAWGGTSLMPWQEMASVQRRSWLGLPLVRVRSLRGGFVQFPWPLADADGFRAAVREYGGPDCPLTHWLVEPAR